MQLCSLTEFSFPKDPPPAAGAAGGGCLLACGSVAAVYMASMMALKVALGRMAFWVNPSSLW